MKSWELNPKWRFTAIAMLREVENLIQKGLVEKPYYINLVLGMMYQGAVDATPSI